MTGILFMTGNTKMPFEDSPAQVLPKVYAHSSLQAMPVC